MKEIFDKIKDKCLLNKNIGRNSLTAFLDILIEVAREYSDENVNNNGWIACSERLPEESGEYYTYVYYDGHYMYSIDEIDCDAIAKEWNCSSDYKIIAWQPLKPYTPNN